jgi:hypothetical protein
MPMMGRFVLAIYLMLHMAAGPWICCCTLFRVAGAVSAWAEPIAEEPAEEPAPKCPCCHTSESDADKSTRKSSDAGKPSPSQRPCCPCHQDAAELPARVVPALSASDVLALEQGFRSALAVAFTAEVAPSAAGAPLDVSLDENLFPFLTAQDILRTHHVLRC